MKIQIKVVLLLLPLLFLLDAGIEAQQARAFNWNLALQNVRSTDLIPFAATVQAKTGEQFRLVISPDDACFCYIIAESPAGNEVGILYSGSIKSGEVWYSPVMELTDPKGTESLFIITSREEQRRLAQRIAAFNGNPGNTQRRALMNEVFRVRSEISKFREEPEKPILMGGASRGTPDKSQGVQFSGLETYVKTISIQH